MANIIRSACKSTWDDVVLEVKHAVIFMDNSCAECLHWSGGPDLLFEAGATDIKEFSAFESGKDDQKKAVFITSTPLLGKTEKTIQDIVKSSSFQYCIAITAVNHSVHLMASGKNEGMEENALFSIFEERLCEWMENMNYTARVIHLPIFLAPILNNLFITPVFDAAYPIQKRDLSTYGEEGEKAPSNLNDFHYYMLPDPYRMMLQLMSASFRSIFERLNCKEEIFVLGHTSHLLGNQLSNSASQQKKQYPLHCGILFIDRTLDLIGPSLHTETSLIDKLLNMLPELTGHCNNIAIDMGKLCTAPASDDSYEDLIFPGCLMPSDSACPALLSDLFLLQSNEALKRVKQSLQEAIAEEELQHDDAKMDAGDVTSDVIIGLVQAFKGNAGAVIYNNNLLQLGMATVQMLESPLNNNWSVLSRTEKLILQQAEDRDSSGILAHLNGLLMKEDECDITVEEVFSILVFATTAVGLSIDHNDDAISDLSSSLSLMLSELPTEELPECVMRALKKTSEEPVDEYDLGQLQDVVNEILKTICEATTENFPLRHFKTLDLSDYHPPSYKPLLSQVVSRILSPNKPDLEPDIKYIFSGFRDFLKKGFSMFRKTAPPRPTDFSNLIIYVIGGITASEVYQVNDVVKQADLRNMNIFLGSNRLVSQLDISDNTLFTNNLLPDFHFD